MALKTDAYINQPTNTYMHSVDGEIPDFALWSTNNLTPSDGANYDSVTLVYHDEKRVSWEANKTFRFEQLVNLQDGTFVAKIYDENDNLLVDSGIISAPSSTLTGAIGIWTFSQKDTTWSDFTYTCL
jgi:hypothetical protein